METREIEVKRLAKQDHVQHLQCGAHCYPQGRRKGGDHMRTTTQKLEWPARPSRRTASTGRKYREWVSTPAAYRVTKFVGDYQPFVAWK